MIAFNVLALLAELPKYLNYAWLMSVSTDVLNRLSPIKGSIFFIQILATDKLLEVDSIKVKHLT